MKYVATENIADFFQQTSRSYFTFNRAPSDKSKTTAIILHLRLSIDSGHTKALQELIGDSAILTNSLLMSARTFGTSKLFPTSQRRAGTGFSALRWNTTCNCGKVILITISIRYLYVCACTSAPIKPNNKIGNMNRSDANVYTLG